MRFGDNLKKLRKQKGISQETLAEKMDVSRQSVSKWENGESYPEMNNILELCKIFKCHINDLVNDSIIDVNLLDNEVKETIVKFKTEQQRKMKFLSKTIYFIALICRIILTVAIPIVVAAMIIMGVVVSKVEINDNVISYDGKTSKISSVEGDDGKKIYFDDEPIDSVASETMLVGMKLISTHSKSTVVFYVEAGFGCLVAFMIVVIVILKYLEKLFLNINKGDTPFTLDNVRYIKRMAILMIVAIELPNVLGLIFEFLLKIDLNIGFEFMRLLEILFLLSMAYIFEYGYELQLDSKGKMYGDIDE